MRMAAGIRSHCRRRTLRHNVSDQTVGNDLLRSTALHITLDQALLQEATHGTSSVGLRDLARFRYQILRRISTKSYCPEDLHGEISSDERHRNIPYSRELVHSLNSTRQILAHRLNSHTKR
jgi:hypothetical protein